MIKIIYFGTAEFAVAPLRALLEAPDKFEVVAVVSRPDKPVGRKQELTAAPVVRFAREKGLTLFQPTRLKDDEFFNALSALAPDVILVASYGRIIPQRILDLPKIAPLNLHGSLLPKYRGASPIQAAILAGETKTGVSLMVMDAEVDHGPVISVVDVAIAPNDTHDSLELKMGAAGAVLMLRDIENYCAGKIFSTEQNHGAASFTSLIDKNDGLITWSQESAERIERKIRAYTPWPGVFFIWNRAGTSLRVKVTTIKIIDAPIPSPPGTTFISSNGNPAIVTKKGAIELVEVHPEGKNPMTGKAFVNGYRDFSNTTL